MNRIHERIRASSSRRLITVVLALLVAGCSAAADPATSRLAPGTEAIVRVAPWADTKEQPRMTTALQDCPDSLITGVPFIPAGSLVRVASDDRPVKMGRTDPPDVDGLCDQRWVQILILEGEHKGKSGLLARSELRPK